MQTQPHNIWWLRASTFLLAALTAANATYWALKWSAPRPVGPSADLLAASPTATDALAVARLLGGGHPGDAAPLARTGAASPFKLLGVLANPAHSGYALIAVNDLPAKPYRVGEPVSDTLLLQSVAARSVALAARLDGPVTQTLELPPLSQP